MQKQLSHFLAIKNQNIRIVSTKNEYESTIAALLIDSEYFVIVENPEWSRRQDINELVGEEFTSSVKGWCVLSDFQKKLGPIVPFNKGREYALQTTFKDGTYSCWLLKIEPNKDSRLLSHPE